MIEAAEILSHYEAIHEAQSRAVTWLEKYQQQAWKQVLVNKLPTPKLESWKYTSLNNYLLTRQLVQATPQINIKDINSKVLKKDKNKIILLPDGNFMAQNLVSSVLVQTAAQLSVQDKKFWEPWLQDLAYFKDDGLNAFNLALANNAVFIHIADHTKLQDPLQLITDVPNLSAQQTYLLNQRVFIRVGRAAQVHLQEILLGELNADVLLNQATQLVLQKSAQVEHTIIAEEAQNNSAIHKHQIIGQEASEYSLNVLASGMRLNRQEFNVQLQGLGAKADLRGILAASAQQRVDLQLFIQHLADYTQSTQFFQGILNDKARGTFNGRVHVQEQVVKVISQQTNNNLLLSNDAQINTKPELVIHTEEVQCTHGATVGRLDKQALFYLQTRGLSKDEAKQLLIHAFMQTALDKMKFTGSQAIMLLQHMACILAAQQVGEG